MIFIGISLLVIYSIALLYITIFCLMQLHLLVHYKRYHKNKGLHDEKTPEVSEEDWPFVTVQLPIYNEMFVVEPFKEPCKDFRLDGVK